MNIVYETRKYKKAIYRTVKRGKNKKSFEYFNS